MQTSWNQDEYTRAYLFAARAHKGQAWPGDPALNYMVHVNLVCMEVIAALQVEPGHDEDLAIKCALLHDVIEDTQVSRDEIRAEFGLAVANGVKSLSKNPDLSKTLKMADSLRRIQQQPREIQMVKLADRIVNLLPPPEDWAADQIKSYRDESILILETLGSASKFLAARLAARIREYGQH